MLSTEMQEALNEQLKWEFFSAYLYLSMAAYFESEGLNGFANWMRVQAQEEAAHAMKFYTFLNERGGRVRLQPIDGPPTEWESVEAVFAHTLDHERQVTAKINKLVDRAIAESDHATHIFLQWFVTEQVEEEASAAEVLQKVRRVGDGGHGLFMLDRELAQRRFTAPAAGDSA